jgi:hypothetical protein
MVIRATPEEWLKRKTFEQVEQQVYQQPVQPQYYIVRQTESSDNIFLLALALGFVSIVAIAAIVALKR